MLLMEYQNQRMGEAESPHIDTPSLREAPQDKRGACDGAIDSDKHKPLPFSYSDTPLSHTSICFLCLEQIEEGDGDQAHIGKGNLKPFHIPCLKKVLPHIGIVTFDQQRNMYIKCMSDDMKMKDGEEVREVRRVVMDGSHRLQVLECLIQNVPLQDKCFDRKRGAKGTRVGRGMKVTKVKKEEKVIMI